MRSLIHMDADAFFASVEQASDLRLRGKPMAVGGEKRGIIASASYEARRYGIYTPMPTAQAKKLCPHLILVPGDYEKYELFSRWMFSYAYDFTPEVEITSIDEGYFDLTGARGSAVEAAKTIRDTIFNSMKIQVSEGIATNKIVSQIASKINKPAAFVYVPPGFERSFLAPLPNHCISGVGPKTSQRLDAAGLTKIGNIARSSEDYLSSLVGSWAPQLKQLASGIDGRPVNTNHAAAKSYSHQKTFEKNVTHIPLIEATLRKMADSLMEKARKDGKLIRTITVKVRYYDFSDDQYSESLSEPTDIETDLYGRLQILLKQTWRRRMSLRLISLKFSNLYKSDRQQKLGLYPEERLHYKKQRLARTVDKLRERRGHHSVMRGHDLFLLKNKDLYH